MSRRDLSLIPRKDCKDLYLNWNFRNARIEAGYTGKGLAEEIGVAESTIRSYERLRALPNPEQARKLSEILNKSIEDLFPKKLRKITKEVILERKNGSSHRYGPRGSPTNPYSLHQIQKKLPAKQKDRTIQIDAREKIEEALQTLPNKRMQNIIRLRYGLIDGCIYALSEAGEIFRIERERVRQIQIEAIKKLQHPKRKRLLAQLL